jgi:hypothetical protein
MLLFLTLFALSCIGERMPSDAAQAAAWHWPWHWLFELKRRGETKAAGRKGNRGAHQSSAIK